MCTNVTKLKNLSLRHGSLELGDDADFGYPCKLDTGILGTPCRARLCRYHGLIALSYIASIWLQ